MDLVTTERELYTDLFQAVEAYSTHAPGEHYVDAFQDMARATVGEMHIGSVLDAGCGTGKGGLALAAKGFRVELADLTDAGLTDEAKKLPFHQVCLWDDLRRLGYFDHIYCCDVLEHVPPTFTMLVVVRLLARARKGVFLSIALQPDQFGVWVGRHLHQTVQSFTAWRDQLACIGRLVESRDLLATGLYYVEPK